MSIFDAMKEKVSELLSGAGDKVSELTGTDVTEQVGGLAETAQGVTDTATETVTGAVEDLPGGITDITK